VVVCAVAAVSLVGPDGAPPPITESAQASTPPPGFEETTVFSGLTNPTVVRFAQDGRVFVAEKSGLIKVFDNLQDTTPTVFADLRTTVYNFWDRGLLGMALDPNFPSVPYVYVLYTYDHVLGDPSPAPKWGTPGTSSDSCPTPPGPTTDGCVVSGRLSRLQASGNVMSGSEQVLVEDWCQQYPSHSIGTVEFGPDGALYAGAGDGASFNFADYGQDGSPLNPCGDPPGGVGATLTPPTAEGGALRSQDLRTGGDPAGLDGSIIRVDPTTGAALPSNPNAGSPDENARRVIAYGMRNPFRFTFRPGTSEIWVGDVGWNDWEEINRILSPTDSTVENFGWSCYEGNSRQSGYDSANLSICENLYGSPGAETGPFFAYHHTAKVVSGETCPTGSSSVAGLSFEFAPSGSSFPSQYQGALFFADYSRDCIWAMKKNGNPIPSPGSIDTFVAGAANPVNLEFGPDKNLYYVDFDGGTIRRIAPVAPPPPPTGTYLSDLTWTSATNGWGPPEKDRSNGESQPADGHTITLNGTTSGKGLGVHAASDVRYALPSGCTRFKASVGVDDEVGANGSVTFEAYADSNKVFDSGRMTGASATQQVDVAITGASQLGLVVTDAGDGVDFDHGDWALARIECAGGGGNQPPVPVIDSPSASLTWKVGDPISFTGHANDPEQGPLAASALSWTLLLQHCPTNCHTHTLQSWSGVASGSFNAPDHDYPSYVELKLTATDAGGLQATTTLRLDPRTVVLSFGSSPSGLQLTVGASASVTPFTRTVIIGSTNSLSATSPQSLGGTSYTFSSWSDGGPQTHNISAPASAATFTATYAGSNAPPVNTLLPAISGSPVKVGRTLAVDNGTWTGSQPMTFAYQWLSCANTGITSCAPIAGATANTYVPVAGDARQRLRATVTATNGVGSSSATSATTSPVK
jgi:glucose/arabinose dehydrogenase